MIKAYRLYTGPDGHSHVVSGSIINHEKVKTGSIHFEESAPHAFFDWHCAPTTQFVITLSGKLEFVTQGGERFIINPGDILIAMDTTGSGHKWRLVDDQPWQRAYVTFGDGVELDFQPDSP